MQEIKPGLIIDGNHSIVISTDDGGVVQIYTGQIWATQDLSLYRTVTKVGRSKDVAQVYWKEGEGEEQKSSVDEFLFWALKSSCRPILQMVVNQIG